MQKLLLIRGLGHSGTTVLDLALGAHSRIFGLGEAIRILQKPAANEASGVPARLRGTLLHSRRCSCGQVASQCPIWGDVLTWLPHNDDRRLSEKLQHLLARVDEHKRHAPPQPEWIVESFQSDLEIPFEPIPDIEIRIIFLVRDVRSWVHSRAADAEKRGKPFPRLRTLARWTRTNLRFQQELQRCNRPVFLLGYEQFALNPEAYLSQICQWLGLELEPNMLQPGNSSTSHILAGNRMRLDPVKTKQIRYDAQWLKGPAWPVAPALLVPALAKLNQRLVYSNGSLNSPD